MTRIADNHFNTLSLASREITDEVKAGELHVVKGAQRIQRTVSAIFPVRTAREALITEIISEFKFRAGSPTTFLSLCVNIHDK